MPSPTHNKGAGFRGFQNPNTSASEFNAQAFLIQSMLARLATSTLVQIKAVTNSGGVSPVGFVDILPLVNQIDGEGNAVPHATVFHCPYLRIQGGTNAVILDPQVGDIGVAVFADRDVSSATANRAPANPGSRRRFDMADGLYLGGMLNGTPTQFVQFESGGITITSPSAVTINAPTLTVNGNTTFNGTVTANGHRIDESHTHGGISRGNSLTDPVT